MAAFFKIYNFFQINPIFLFRIFKVFVNKFHLGSSSLTYKRHNFENRSHISLNIFSKYDLPKKKRFLLEFYLKVLKLSVFSQSLIVLTNLITNTGFSISIGSLQYEQYKSLIFYDKSLTKIQKVKINGFFCSSVGFFASQNPNLR